MKRLLVVLALVVGMACFPMAGTSHATPVSLELAILVDVSGSVDASEYAIQKQGYISAFNNISSFGAYEPFAVSYIEWSGSTQQSVRVPWTLIENDASAAAFADAIAAAPRAFSGMTAVGSAITFGVNQILNNDFDGTRKIIDISGDGTNNQGVSSATGRDYAIANNVIVNGLPILTDVPTLDAYYQNNVITPGGFLIAAATFEDVERATYQKLRREIVVPEPGTLSLLILGLGGLGIFGLRRKSKA